MTAMTLGVGFMDPEEIEGLLPWHAAGTLNSRDARRVEDALTRDPRLARQYALIQDEIAETIHVNESLGAPSSRAMQRLFAAIDAEPAQAARRSSGIVAGVADFLLSLSPRTLAYSAAVGALALVLQAGVIGVIVTKKLPGGYETASWQGTTGGGVNVLVRFDTDAKLSDINQLLDAYNASVVAGPNAGMFKVWLGDKPMTRDEADALVKKLRGEKIVNFAEQAQ